MQRSAGIAGIERVPLGEGYGVDIPARRTVAPPRTHLQLHLANAPKEGVSTVHHIPVANFDSQLYHVSHGRDMYSMWKRGMMMAWVGSSKMEVGRDMRDA